MMGGQTLTGDSLLGHSLADGGTLLAETELGSGFFAPGGSTGPATLANLTSLLFGWASSGETDDYIFAGGAGPGTLSTDGFSIVFTVVPNQVPQVPQVPIVPLPASLPLLLAAVFGLGLVRRRRRSA